MRGEIDRRERDGGGKEGDRARAVAGLRELRRALAQRVECGLAVLESGLCLSEADVGIALAVLGDELVVGLLGLTEPAGGEKPRRRVARELVAAALVLRGSPQRRRVAARKRVSKLHRFLRAHDTHGVLADVVGEWRDVLGTDGVGVDPELVQFAGQEGLGGRAEVALRHAQQGLREGVQSSPPLGSSESA